jgi:spore coat polysaccharide biosynthesis protein SpsF
VQSGQERRNERRNSDKTASLALGTAQLGLPYGAANVSGMPDEAEAVAIVTSAVANGIRTIDTARAYGDAEHRIGLACPTGTPDVEIVTKLDPLANVPDDAPAEVAVGAARASLAVSRQALRRDRLDVLLLHRAQHRTHWGGAIWDLLRAEREAGAIGRIGVSVQTPAEALAALDDVDVGQLQLPFNLLDRRWHAEGVVDRLRTRPDVVVHVRSVFLQGLLTGAPAARWPAIAGFDSSALVDRLKALASDLKRENLTDLALAFVRGQTWIDAIIIGLETREQLAANVALFQRTPLTAAECDAVHAALPPVPNTLVDPPLWPKVSVQP